PWKSVPAVTLNWYRHPEQCHLEREVSQRRRLFSEQRGHSTPPGQRRSARNERHSSPNDPSSAGARRPRPAGRCGTPAERGGGGGEGGGDLTSRLGGGGPKRGHGLKGEAPTGPGRGGLGNRRLRR